MRRYIPFRDRHSSKRTSKNSIGVEKWHLLKDTSYITSEANMLIEKYYLYEELLNKRSVLNKTENSIEVKKWHLFEEASDKIKEFRSLIAELSKLTNFNCSFESRNFYELKIQLLILLSNMRRPLGETGESRANRIAEAKEAINRILFNSNIDSKIDFFYIVEATLEAFLNAQENNTCFTKYVITCKNE
ncbi:UNVERIFIED_CONTAM: hypothetical protein NCL1_22467 [Trichonephila clavipes]